MYYIIMDNDRIVFDESKMVNAIRSSSTYNEFRIKCDIDDNECIITKDEFEHFKKLYGHEKYVDVTSINL